MNALLYLMRVGQAFDSHREIWASSALTHATKEAKAADVNELGDIYRPRSPTASPFRPSSYAPPIVGHPHRQKSCETCGKAGEWHRDVNYLGSLDRRPALLMGQIGLSFLWDLPIIFLPLRLHRGQRKEGLGSLLSQLVEREES